MNANNVCAIILTGGLSKRMGGENKTFKKFNNRIIFDRILNKVESQVGKIIISSNGDKNLFNSYKIVVVADILKGFLGPLAGIHSGFKWLIDNEIKCEWLATIPGDTPFIPDDLIEKLIEKANLGNHKIIIAKSFGKIHPTVGLWHISLYKNLEENIIKGKRKILDWASNHSLKYLEFKGFKYDPFFNINYKEDIKKAEEIENNYLY